MTREEFEIYRNKLMERFYWCTTRAEMRYLTKEKGYRFLFRCTHFKTNKYFWVFDKTNELLKEAEAFRRKRQEKKSKLKESEVIVAE